ncbi:hypothetical protein NMG60_11012893 [Bertholletia excelsa]
MDGSQSCRNFQSQGVSEPVESRVSVLSIGERATNLSSKYQPEYEVFHRLREHDDMQDSFCFMSHQLATSEECETDRYPPKMEESNKTSSRQQEISKCDVCVAELHQVASQENNQENGQETSELEECSVELPHCFGEKDEQSSLLSQQMDEPKVYIEVPKYKNGDYNQKSSFMDQKVNDPEECDIELPQHAREVNDKKNEIMSQQISKHGAFDPKLSQQFMEDNANDGDSNKTHEKQRKYFYYGSPLSEETGVWIPVSVPPLSESDHEEWTRGLYPNGGYFPEGDMGWNLVVEEDKALTMWDVVVEMLLAARGKVSAFSYGDIHRISWISSHLVEQAWKEMAETLTEANANNTMEILEAEPPKWLPDSAASACMLCSIRFHPIMCSRHHCRFCGGIFCGECSRGRSLLPVKFHVADPQRVCDVCCVRLESVQPYLMDQVSRAAQLPTHDVTDLSTLRSWVNFPWGQSMEYEIYKATNTIQGYNEKVGSRRPEKAIPDAILRSAKGLAILSVVKVGVMVTYNIGTGLVIGRREDGLWSPPSAISSIGVGWGAQAGGELIDLIVVLRTDDAIKMFSGDVHLSIGAGLSAAVGIVGRMVEADMRAGDGGYAACYTYSCSKGAFVGCSLEGSIVTTRTRENSRFYGSQSITASDILLGSLPRPPAAAILYRALGDLYQNLGADP